MSTFQSLSLNPLILNNLKAKGYEIPTPIQLQAIPKLLEGRDLLGIAQTGTGKTAAFALPLIHHLLQKNLQVPAGSIRTLILTPTRELATQINDNIVTYSKGSHIRTAVVFGGVSQVHQVKNIQMGLDVLIATPGRLLDLVNQRLVNFNALEFLVLDEADRMLDMGFINDIRRLMKIIPTKRQTLLFSATMPKEIESLANSLLRNPVKIAVTPAATTVEKIEQRLNYVSKAEKKNLLKKIIDTEKVESVLVFTRTKHGADKLVKLLNIPRTIAAAIHGNKSQNNRENALKNFRAGTLKVLVATDIAARGIDIPDLSHVINFDVPTDPEAYVHRIGRTARAGKSGVAITFCDETEMDSLKSVQKLIKYQIPVTSGQPFGSMPLLQTKHVQGFSNRKPKRVFR